MSPHILIVDDDASIRKLFRTVLGRDGYRVSVAADAESALNLLEQDSFDLLVTDKNLPGLSGFDLVLRARTIFPDLPAIMITGFAEPLLASTAPLQGYLPKPLNDLAQISLTVRRALEMRQMLVSFRARHEKAPAALSVSDRDSKPKS